MPLSDIFVREIVQHYMNRLTDEYECKRGISDMAEMRTRSPKPRQRRDQDVKDFVRDETETRRMRPSRDRYVETETTSLQDGCCC